MRPFALFPLYFWRDFTGNEIDVIIDGGKQPVPGEIKAGQTVASDYFKSIAYWRKLSGDAGHPAALVYGGKNSFRIWLDFTDDKLSIL